jgi:hypothetical protein
MMIFFIVLIPLMILGGSIPALVISLIQMTPLGHIPHIDLLFSLGGLVFGCLIAWVFFLTIYLVVPNQPVSFRRNWLGALVSALLVQLYLTLFPFYVAHFLNTYTGSAGAAGFAVILLLFLYYFAVILLLGAEINAYVGDDIRVTPANIPAMVHQLTSHLPTNEQDVLLQATIGHKDTEPKAIRPKGEVQQLEARANAKTMEIRQARADQAGQTTENDGAEKKKPGINPSSTLFVLIEVATGTVLAFVLTVFRLRQENEKRKPRT